MLNAFVKKREQKNATKALEHYQKGTELLINKLFKQAMVEFNHGCKIDPQLIGDRLTKDFDNYYEVGESEAALSIGVILLKIKTEDFQFVNQLGNCARRQENYKYANTIYRHALKINQKYDIAFYNLAASMAKVERYDDDIRITVQKISKLKQYVTPEYVGGKEYFAKITARLSEVKKKQKTEHLNQLKEKLRELKDEKNYAQGKITAFEIKQEEDKPLEVAPEDYYGFFSKMSADLKKRIDPEGITKWQENLFNFCIYALSNKNGKIALEPLKLLSTSHHSLDYIPLLKAIAYACLNQQTNAVDLFINLLGKDRFNRYYNTNLGLLYKWAGNRLLATKYLLIAAVLLEKSKGLFRLSDLIEQADRHYKKGENKQALTLYQVALAEKVSTDIILKVGNIYFALARYVDAKNQFNKVLKADPKNVQANNQLLAIHDHYCQKGENFFTEGFFKNAAKSFDRALEIIRVPKTLKRTAEIYKFLKDQGRVTELMAEYNGMMENEEEKEREESRLEFIKLGKSYLKQKLYHRAIENLELAFRMKTDKDIFILLAALYKNLKRVSDLESLINRWNKMLEYEEKIKKYEQAEQRSKS